MPNKPVRCILTVSGGVNRCVRGGAAQGREPMGAGGVVTHEKVRQQSGEA